MEKTNLTGTINVRFTGKQKEEIVTAAIKQNMTPSSFVRKMILDLIKRNKEAEVLNNEFLQR